MSRASGQLSSDAANRSRTDATERRAIPQCVAIARALRPSSKWKPRIFFTFLIGSLPRAIPALLGRIVKVRGVGRRYESPPKSAAPWGGYFGEIGWLLSVRIGGYFA